MPLKDYPATGAIATRTPAFSNWSQTFFKAEMHDKSAVSTGTLSITKQQRN